MRKIFLILLELSLSIVAIALPSKSTIFKFSLINDVERGRTWYLAAIQDLQNIDDWTLSPDYEAQWVSEEKEQDFISYLDSIGFDTELRDQFIRYAEKCRRYYAQEYANTEATEYLADNDLASAIPCLLTSCEMYKELFGENHLNYAIDLYNLACAYMGIEDYIQSEKYMLESIRIFENVLDLNTGQKYVKVGGDGYLSYTKALNGKGVLYLKMNKFDEAKQQFKFLMDVYEVLPDAKVEYITSINHLALIYSLIDGDFNTSEILLEKARQTCKDKIGEDSSLYAEILNSLAQLYSHTGNYSKSKKLHEQVLQIKKETEGEFSIDYASALSAMAFVYDFIDNDKEKALHTTLQVLEIEKEIYGEHHSTYLTELKNLGALYYDMDSIEQAQKCFSKVLDMALIYHGENSDIYASACQWYGWHLFTVAKDTTQAEPYLTKCAQVINSIYGSNHAKYINSIGNLCLLYQAKGEYQKAEKGFREEEVFIKSRHVQACEYMGEAQRTAYWKKDQWFYDETATKFTFFYYPQDQSIAGWGYNNELFAKGMLLQSSNAIKRSILESGDTTLIRQWKELVTLKQTVSALQTNSPASKFIPQYEAKAEKLEKEITRKSAAFRENMRQWAITWDSVRAALKPNQVAIEYMRAPLNKDRTMYCALLLRDTCSYPIMIPLFEEKEVSSLLHQTSDNKDNINATYAYDQNGKQLAQLVWGKVLPYINEGEVVFFAPTGVLHQIAIEHLPFTESNTIGDKYNLVRLSSTRELAINRPAIPHQNATLYGGIFYEPMESDVLLANTAKYRGLQSKEQHTSSMHTTRHSIAPYLPGSKAEVDSIRPILEKKDIAVTVYSRDTAYEESFKALSGKQPNILLLSTHGFFWQDSTAKQESYFNQRSMLLGEGNISKVSTTIDPLERCGLLFAGANTALSGRSDRLPQGVDDGVLTAKELSVLDFRNTDIVVLSACETGLGDISGEGVFGLQRAFKMAGVQTIIMSLWKVDDNATQLLMTEFYRNWILSNGKLSKRAAFRKAQNTVRAQYSHPADWAGFIILD